MPSRVKDGGAVHLGEGVAQGCEPGGVADPERRGRRQPGLETRDVVVGSVDQGGTDPARGEIVHGEVEERMEHRDVAVGGAGRDGVDPALDGRLVVPGVALPAQHTERAADSYRAGGVSLHEGGAEDFREHHEIAL